MKSEKISFRLILATLKIALAASTLRQNGCKTRLQRKIFVAESFHITFQTSKYIN